MEHDCNNRENKKTSNWFRKKRKKDGSTIKTERRNYSMSKEDKNYRKYIIRCI